MTTSAGFVGAGLKKLSFAKRPFAFTRCSPARRKGLITIATQIDSSAYEPYSSVGRVGNKSLASSRKSAPRFVMPAGAATVAKRSLAVSAYAQRRKQIWHQ
jgi:hypothetical protein